MAEMAEYLRVGTTTLVLDVIEAGALPPLPALANPIKALHDICRDPSLHQRVPFADGTFSNALEIQRFYFEACRHYVGQSEAVQTDVIRLLGDWDATLRDLESLQQTGIVPQHLVGAVDWVTKKHLIDEAGHDHSWEARKKIDICYHELGPFGYFQMLKAAGLASSLVDLEEIERAVRMPPADSPATMRGHYIREFSSDATPLTANWKSVQIGGRAKTKTIRLDRYSRQRRVDNDRLQQNAHHR